MSETPIFQPYFNPREHTVETVSEYKTIPHGEKVMHNNLFNVDIFSDNRVEKTPLFAEQVFGRKLPLNNWFGLKNTKTEELLDCSPCSDTYKLINHEDLFHEQAKMISVTKYDLSIVVLPCIF